MFSAHDALQIGRLLPISRLWHRSASPNRVGVASPSPSDSGDSRSQNLVTKDVENQCPPRMLLKREYDQQWDSATQPACHRQRETRFRFEIFRRPSMSLYRQCTHRQWNAIHMAE